MLVSTTHHYYTCKQRVSFCSSVNFIGVPSAPMLESTVLHCYTCGRERSSFSSSFNFISVHSSPVSQFLLLQCQFYLNSFCSKCQRVQYSGAPDIAETGVLSPPVSILLEFLLLQSQFYRSSFFSGLNFITVPSSPLSKKFFFFLNPLACILGYMTLCSTTSLQCKYHLPSSQSCIK